VRSDRRFSPVAPTGWCVSPGGEASPSGRMAAVDRLSSEVVYANAWMTVREDVVRHLDGSEGPYGVVEKPDFALVLPRGDGGFWMVEQFRYPIGRVESTKVVYDPLGVGRGVDV
jgi:hypothetical protein